MKNEAISKINKFGRIGNIITLIGKIFVGICMVSILVGAVALFILPKDFLNVNLSTNVEMDFNVEGLSEKITDVRISELQTDLVTAAGEDKEDYVVTNIEIDGYNVAITENEREIDLSIRNIAWLMILLDVGLAMIMVVLFFAASLCKAFRDCETPFEDVVIKKMQNLAFSLIPWVFVSSIVESVTESIKFNMISITLGIDLGVVLIILIVFALVYIFKYGAVLQQESDETL